MTMQITDLNNTIKKAHDFKINELNQDWALFTKNSLITLSSYTPLIGRTLK